MDTVWYYRLFYVPVINLLVSILLFKIIDAKRMTSPGPRKAWAVVYFMRLFFLCVLMRFVPFNIDLAFWIGIWIIVFGQVVFALGYMAMREHPEQNKAVVDWGIYSVSRHSHVVAGEITTLGAIVMGWNFNSTVYVILWVYFFVGIISTHFAILSEEKVNIEKFGRAYDEYMKRVPRYLLLK